MPAAPARSGCGPATLCPAGNSWPACRRAHRPAGRVEDALAHAAQNHFAGSGRLPAEVPFQHLFNRGERLGGGGIHAFLCEGPEFLELLGDSLVRLGRAWFSSRERIVEQHRPGGVSAVVSRIQPAIRQRAGTREPRRPRAAWVRGARAGGRCGRRAASVLSGRCVPDRVKHGCLVAPWSIPVVESVIIVVVLDHYRRSHRCGRRTGGGGEAGACAARWRRRWYWRLCGPDWAGSCDGVTGSRRGTAPWGPTAAPTASRPGTGVPSGPARQPDRLRVDVRRAGRSGEEAAGHSEQHRDNQYRLPSLRCVGSCACLYAVRPS